MFRAVWKRIVGVFTGLTGTGRAFLGGVFGARVGDPPVLGTREFLQIYETSPWVRAVHGRISTVIGATEWHLESQRGTPIRDDHIMLTTLRAPNRLMTGHDLFKITQLYLDLVGDAFWLKVRNGVGAPTEFWPVPPHWIIELPTPELPRYRVSYYGWQGFIPDTEIAWFHDAAPVDPYRRGAGISRAMSDEIETHEYASKHAKQLFWNRATPEFVVMDPDAGGEEIKVHERAWTQRLQGFWRNNKPYFTNRKLEFWQPQTMNLDNLTMVPLMKYERDVILQTVGMPPEQLGIVENSNRATIDGSDYVFEHRIIRPRRDFLRDCLQMKIAPEYDEKIVVTYTDTVPEDREFRMNLLRACPWILQVDEIRELYGEEPLGGEVGKSHYIPMHGYLTDEPLDLTQRPAAGGAAQPAGGMTPGEPGEPGEPSGADTEPPASDSPDEPNTEPSGADGAKALYEFLRSLQ